MDLKGVSIGILNIYVKEKIRLIDCCFTAARRCVEGNAACHSAKMVKVESVRRKQSCIKNEYRFRPAFISAVCDNRRSFGTYKL